MSKKTYQSLQEWLSTTNPMNKHYLAQIISLITMLEVGDEISLGLVKVKKESHTNNGYTFSVSIDSSLLE